MPDYWEADMRTLPKHEDRCEALRGERRCEKCCILNYQANGQRVRLCQEHFGVGCTRAADLVVHEGHEYAAAMVQVLRELTGQAAVTTRTERLARRRGGYLVVEQVAGAQP